MLGETNNIRVPADGSGAIVGWRDTSFLLDVPGKGHEVIITDPNVILWQGSELDLREALTLAKRRREKAEVSTDEPGHSHGEACETKDKLLEACQQAVKVLEQCRSKHHSHLSTAHQILTAAIAKAQGHRISTTSSNMEAWLGLTRTSHWRLGKR